MKVGWSSKARSSFFLLTFLETGKEVVYSDPLINS